MTRALQHADFADDADFLSDLTGKKQKTKSPITVVSGLVVQWFSGLVVWIAETAVMETVVRITV